MNVSKRHTLKFFPIGILLTCAVFYFIGPINHGYSHDVLISYLQSNIATYTDSGITDQSGDIRSAGSKKEAITCEAFRSAKVRINDFESPADKHSDAKQETLGLSLKESKDIESTSTGMDKLVFIKQAVMKSFLPVEGFSPNLQFLVRYKKYLPEEYWAFFEYRSVFSHILTLSPLEVGIAINAP